MIGRAAAVKALVVVTITGLLITGVPGSAAATPVVQDTPSVPAVPAAALANWPSQLLMFVSGTDQFKARYLGDTRQQLELPVVDDSPDKAPRKDSSCKDKGGDVGLYTVDFVRHLGDVLNALGNLPARTNSASSPPRGRARPPLRQSEGRTTAASCPSRGMAISTTKGTAHLVICRTLRTSHRALRIWPGTGRRMRRRRGGSASTHSPTRGRSMPCTPSSPRSRPIPARRPGSRSFRDRLLGLLQREAEHLGLQPDGRDELLQVGDDPNPFCMSAMFLHCRTCRPRRTRPTRR